MDTPATQWQYVPVTLLFPPNGPQCLPDVPGLVPYTIDDSHLHYRRQVEHDALLALALSASEIDASNHGFTAHESLRNETGGGGLETDAAFADEGPLLDLHSRFQYYNTKLFGGKLAACEVRWSPRMTFCAGQCHYRPAEQYCSVRLSSPLLQFRPKMDAVDTLLHEMIHAYLFVTDGNDDHDGHGPAFHQHMARINAAEGTSISVYHSFKDEVKVHRTHVWRCNGPCAGRAPYFGYVRRSMNRPPQPADSWWQRHLASCGGTYTKISGPEPAKKAKRTRKSPQKKETVTPLTAFWKTATRSPAAAENDVVDLTGMSSSSDNDDDGDDMILDGPSAKRRRQM
ncbi:SprT-like family-domain-containing protein [Blastocladiella britannica]|nr:SprT-like family-domain-containing protein [Blastocladiella britannica]